MSVGAAATAVPLDVLKPSTPAAAHTADREKIAKTARTFEAQVLSTMLQSMFADVNISPPFGGGAGEDAFKSFLTDAFAKKIAARGGVGIAASVQREMLKMQGLT